MKRLSEFQDEQAIKVVAKLLVPIGNIMNTPGVESAEGKTVIEYASCMLEKCAKDVKDMLAILNEEDPKSFRCNAATVMRDVVTMFSDKELMALFISQSQTEGSKTSGSASENIMAPDQ